MTLWEAIILGLVEGITEYLPVSSTGHLIIAAGLLGLGEDPASQSAVDAFTIVVQGGAILAVLGLYRERVKQMARGALGLLKRDRDGASPPDEAAGRALLLRLIVAFLPAAVLGVMLDELIERYLFSLWPVVAALALGGVFMIWIDRWRRNRAERSETSESIEDPDLHEIPIRSALIIGLLQCIAMWPGTSRSMMTITGGVLVGMRPQRAAEFSFLLGLPTLGGATVYKLAKNLKDSHDAGVPNMFETLGVTPVLVGVAVATISAAIAVKWLVGFLNRHGLAPFGWYRLVVAAALAVLALAGLVEVG